MLVYFFPHRAHAAAQCRCLLERGSGSRPAVPAGQRSGVRWHRHSHDAHQKHRHGYQDLKFPCVKKKSFKGCFPPVSGCPPTSFHEKARTAVPSAQDAVFAAENAQLLCLKRLFPHSGQHLPRDALTYVLRRCPARHAGHPHDPALHRHPWPRSPAGPPQYARRCRSRFGSADPDRAASAAAGQGDAAVDDICAQLRRGALQRLLDGAGDLDQTLQQSARTSSECTTMFLGRPSTRLRPLISMVVSGSSA